MKPSLWIFILAAMTAGSRAVHSQVLETNPAAGPIAATNRQPADHSPHIPLIKLTNIPITAVIENLARQSDLNYLIDPKLFPIMDARGHPLPEPLMTFTLTNISARAALDQVLNVRNLVMIEDPVTRIARITRINQAANVVDGSLLGVDANHPAPATNEIIPLMQFSDVPLTTALENLFRQAGIPVVLDPRITGTSAPFAVVPTVSLRWENVSVRQAILALCQNYDLIIAMDAATGGLRVEPKPPVKK